MTAFHDFCASWTKINSPDLTDLVCADDLPRKRPASIYKPPTAEMLAYLDFSVSTTGMLTGVKARFVSFSQIRLKAQIYLKNRLLRKQTKMKFYFGSCWKSSLWLVNVFELTLIYVTFFDIGVISSSFIRGQTWVKTWTQLGIVTESELKL